MKDKFHISVVDDEPHLRTSLEYALSKEGYSVSLFPDGRSAWDTFQTAMPQLAILDIMMPLMDGLELCRKMRGLSDDSYIIFLTSKDEEFDKVLGLEIGADDYLCKPFSMRELVARVKVLFRRWDISYNKMHQNISEEDTLAVGNVILNINEHSVSFCNNPVPLTVSEFRILRKLVENPGYVKTREQLAQAAYPEDNYVSDRSIDCHIKRIRKKFSALQEAGDFNNIETVYGLGYKYTHSPDN